MYLCVQDGQRLSFVSPGHWVMMTTLVCLDCTCASYRPLKHLDAMENTMFNINRNCILYRLICSEGPCSVAMIIPEATCRNWMTRDDETAHLREGYLDKATLWRS